VGPSIERAKSDVNGNWLDFRMAATSKPAATSAGLATAAPRASVEAASTAGCGCGGCTGCTGCSTDSGSGGCDHEEGEVADAVGGKGKGGVVADGGALVVKAEAKPKRLQPAMACSRVGAVATRLKPRKRPTQSWAKRPNINSPWR
jgi:hypothetical protein